MDSLNELRRQKTELKAKIEQQQLELKKTFQEVREEVEPANLLKKAVSGVFGFSKNNENETQTGIFKRLPAPLSLLTDLLIKNSRAAFVVKMLAPMALKFYQNRRKAANEKEAADETEAPKIPVKAKIYSGLRRGIAALRNQLKKTAKSQEALNETMPELNKN